MVLKIFACVFVPFELPNTHVSQFNFGPLVILLHVSPKIEIIYECLFTLVTFDTNVTNVNTYSHIILILRIISKRSIKALSGNCEMEVFSSLVFTKIKVL